jgi:hypothetical protein
VIGVAVDSDSHQFFAKTEKTGRVKT